MKSLFVHTDIRKASTLTSEFYTSKENFEIAKEKIFCSSWQLVGDTDELKLSGQLVPKTILPGFLNEPILLTRDSDDNLHCVSNICTHRGNILVENNCIEKNIRCRYHGRKFNLDGCFKHMPEFESVENFPSEKDNLHKIEFNVWEKFIFASLKPSIKSNDLMDELIKRISFLPLNQLKLDSVRSRDYLVKAHWALYCENYLEGFHIPFIHNSLNNIIDYNTYSTELYRYSNLQVALSKGNEPHFELPKHSPDYGKKVAAYYFWLFPNMMFNFYPWGLSVNIVKPINKELTKVSFLTYVYPETKMDDQANVLLDKVEREDEAIVENVQRGIRSRFYDSGRYSPTRETGTHHFHQLICEFMNRK